MADPTSPAFADLLRQFRRAAGLTQEELATRSGTSVRAISDLERGVRQHPQRATVRLLSDGLQLSPADRAMLLAAARRPVRAAAPVRGARSELPIPRSSLIGRQADLARIEARLQHAEAALVTITGPGGVGKTRLALAAAEQAAAHFPDGVGFVDLAPIQDPTLVLATIAVTLGISEQRQRSLSETLADAWRGQRRLLVLDNCEQVAAAAPDLAQLLQQAPGLVILATSRARLGVSVEQDVPLAPLPVADPDHLPDLPALAAVASIQLFVRRAQAVKPDFALTAANAAALARICHRLDGLPLAIELAAARITLLSAADLAGRLDHSLPLLTDGPRDWPARQQTLRDTIAWSYALLTPDEQMLFAWLAIFVGGWTLERAEAIVNGDGRLDVLARLGALRDQSLIFAVDQPDGQIRFGMLETVREFAVERLAARDEVDALATSHAMVYRRWLRAHEVDFWGAEQAIWLQGLATEHPNLRAALTWLVEHRSIEEVLELAAYLASFWDGYGWGMSGYVAEGQRWLERALALYPQPTRLRAFALLSLGGLRWAQGAYREAMPTGEEAERLAHAVGDAVLEVRALCHQGACAEFVGDDDASIGHYERAFALARATDQPQWAAHARMCLGDAAYRQGRFERAHAFSHEALAFFRAAGIPFDAAAALNTLAHVAVVQGDLRQAKAHLREALDLALAIDHHWMLASVIATAGSIAAAQGDPLAATCLLSAADARLTVIGQGKVCAHVQYNQTLAQVRAALDPDAFRQAWEAGQQLTLPAALQRVQVGTTDA